MIISSMLRTPLVVAIVLVGCSNGSGAELGAAGSSGTGAGGTGVEGAGASGLAGAETGGSAGSLATGGAGVGGMSGGATGTAGGSAGAGGSGGSTAGLSGASGTGGAAGSDAGAAGSIAAGAGGVAGAAGDAGAGGATGGSAGQGMAGTGGDACDIAVYDPNNPPKMLSLSGSLGTHDPAVLLEGGTYYLFDTGLGAKTSTDLLSWRQGSAPSRPSWVSQEVPGATNLWAPDPSSFGGLFHLYYAASTFGSNHSCMGHATRASMTTGSWTDDGEPVLCSNNGTNDNWNAIDPNVIVDGDGTPWLAFGSFWSGIKLVKLDETGHRADTQVLSIAGRGGGGIEGPYIVRRCGYYYLFVSFGACCNSPWDYDIRVGRSPTVTGPYVDKAGTEMMSGGGTLLVEGNGTVTAPGHNAVLITPTGAYNIYHALNANHGSAQLRIAELAWDEAGWPISAGP